MKTNKETTIYDIARVLNISASTVSRGLNDHPAIRKDTKKKIQQVAMEMGYQHNTFASNLRRKHTRTVGVIVPKLDSYFMSTVIAGIEKKANDLGYNVLIGQSQESVLKESSGILTMFNSRVDGLLISLSTETKNLDHFKILFKKGIPLIFFDRVFEHPDCVSIVIDNFKAGYEATKHLIDQGCKKIVHLGGSQYSNVYVDRFKGYKKALADNNMDFDDDLVIFNKLDYKCGIEVVRQMLKLDPVPDGVFAANDASAVAVICGFKQFGKQIPQDIAVVGFNNTPMSTVVEPNLTTINYPGEEMGEVAITTLINQIKNVNSHNLNTIVLRHDLIIRPSSARNKSG
ncbi:MAG: LacI family DNA-binding transcriptional regulator [Bacteroidales bacterium]|nr:LacI family DNA-binding transcriptional regulator [Bacteroidales bacterium]